MEVRKGCQKPYVIPTYKINNNSRELASAFGINRAEINIYSHHPSSTWTLNIEENKVLIEREDMVTSEDSSTDTPTNSKKTNTLDIQILQANLRVKCKKWIPLPLLFIGGGRGEYEPSCPF